LKRIVPLLWGVLLAPAAFCGEIVALQTRPGVTQSFLIADMGERKPEAAALLFSGGGGNFRLRVEDGRIKLSTTTISFFVRSHAEFLRNGILPVLVTSPSDQKAGDGMSAAFRESAAHAVDIRAVVAEVKQRYPGVPVFLASSSSSTLSAVHLAIALEGEIAGVVLSSTWFYRRDGRMRVLKDFDWSRIRSPLLLVHHVDDGCEGHPYHEAAALGRRFPLVTVSGGKRPESGPCAGLSPHGHFGKEAETVDAIAAWMLGKPVQKEIR
jgi:hypothetical protein